MLPDASDMLQIVDIRGSSRDKNCISAIKCRRYAKKAWFIKGAEMLKEFDIVIKEELARIIKVKAENLEAAIDNVAEQYYRGEIVLDAEDLVGKEIASVIQN